MAGVVRHFKGLRARGGVPFGHLDEDGNSSARKGNFKQSTQPQVHRFGRLVKVSVQSVEERPFPGLQSAAVGKVFVEGGVGRAHAGTKPG